MTASISRLSRRKPLTPMTMEINRTYIALCKYLSLLPGCCRTHARRLRRKQSGDRNDKSKVDLEIQYEMSPPAMPGHEASIKHTETACSTVAIT
jgi:hypothetical protein